MDDFIGSGGSVVTALSLEEKKVRPEVLSDASSGRLYVIVAIVMDNGYSKISQDISGAVILGDLHCKGFDPHKKVLGSYFKTKAVSYSDGKYCLGPMSSYKTMNLDLLEVGARAAVHYLLDTLKE